MGFRQHMSALTEALTERPRTTTSRPRAASPKAMSRQRKWFQKLRVASGHTRQTEKGRPQRNRPFIIICAVSAPDARPTYQLDQLASTVVNAMLNNLGPAGELARAGLELAVDQGVKLDANQLETLDHGLAIE